MIRYRLCASIVNIRPPLYIYKLFIYYIFFSANEEVSAFPTSTVDCFQAGQCRESFHLTGKQMNDEFGCHNFCQSENECGWFTFSPLNNYCELFQDCSHLDTERCPDCLSGPKNCTEGKKYKFQSFLIKRQ